MIMDNPWSMWPATPLPFDRSGWLTLFILVLYILYKSIVTYRRAIFRFPSVVLFRYWWNTIIYPTTITDTNNTLTLAKKPHHNSAATLVTVCRLQRFFDSGGQHQTLLVYLHPIELASIAACGRLYARIVIETLRKSQTVYPHLQHHPHQQQQQQQQQPWGSGLDAIRHYTSMKDLLHITTDSENGTPRSQRAIRRRRTTGKKEKPKDISFSLIHFPLAVLQSNTPSFPVIDAMYTALMMGLLLFNSVLLKNDVLHILLNVFLVCLISDGEEAHFAMGTFLAGCRCVLYMLVTCKGTPVDGRVSTFFSVFTDAVLVEVITLGILFVQEKKKKTRVRLDDLHLYLAASKRGVTLYFLTHANRTYGLSARECLLLLFSLSGLSVIDTLIPIFLELLVPCGTQRPLTVPQRTFIHQMMNLTMEAVAVWIAYIHLRYTWVSILVIFTGLWVHWSYTDFASGVRTVIVAYWTTFFNWICKDVWMALLECTLGFCFGCCTRRSLHTLTKLHTSIMGSPPF